MYTNRSNKWRKENGEYIRKSRAEGKKNSSAGEIYLNFFMLWGIAYKPCNQKTIHKVEQHIVCTKIKNKQN